MPINELTPVNEWPTRKLPQDRFDDAVKKAMDQMSVMVDELNENFIPQTNESVEVINKISPNIDTILDAPNQAAAAAASAQSAASSKTAAAQSASEAAASKKAAASSASSASASKTTAAQSATEAAASASSASSSEAAAAQSASEAADSKNAAASSASSASASKTAAAQSATEAAASASSASSSKTAAAQSAATASSEADRAEGEADRAKNEADRIASIVAVDVASDTKAGIVKTDSKTLFVTDRYGTLTAEDVAIDGVLTDTARGRGQIGACYAIPNSGVDFNTLTKAGRYWFSDQAFNNSTNKPPANGGGFCDVLGEESANTYTKQFYHQYNIPVIYIREHKGANSQWSKNWTKIITENSIATTSVAGLVKPDGATLKMADAAGKMVVQDIAIRGNASDLASARGRFGKLVDATGITSLWSIRVTCDLHFWAGDWNNLADRPFESKAGAIVSVRSNESGVTSRGYILAKSLSTGEMWIAYWNENTTSAFRKVITSTDFATPSTPGIIKVGRGLAVSNDGTLRYASMGTATYSVGHSTRLTSSSARNAVIKATGASPSLFLPDPYTLYVGEQFTFFAEGDNIQVRDFQGQSIGPVLARGKAYLFTLIDKTTGEWARAEFSASGTSGDGGSLGLQPSISAPVLFSDVAEAYSTDIELETGRVLHFGAPGTSGGGIAGGTLSLVSVTGWRAVSVKNTSLTLPQNFILHDFLKLSSSLCCVLAKDTTTNKKFAVIPVDVSGATAVVGTANILTTTGTLGKPIFSRVDDAHALLVYGDGTSLYARLYSFSGSTVTAAAPVLVREASSTDISKLNVQRMDDTRWLLRTGDYSLQILKVSGTSITVGEPVTFTPDASWASSGFNAVSPTPGGDVLIDVAFQRKDESTSQYVGVNALLVYTSSGLVLTEGTLTEISELYTNVMFLNIAGRMFLWGYKTSSSKDYYLVPVTVGNGTATAGAECLIFTTSEIFYNNLTLLTYTGDTYAIISTYERDDDGQLILLKGECFAIASDGSLTKVDPSGPATSISNILEGRNPCIQAFPGGRYVHAYYRSGGTGTTTVSVQNSSWESLGSATVTGFASKPFTASHSASTNYLYPSVFPTGEAQALVILNQYDSRKPAWALFTL